jgi:putative ABC transport system permease protein
LEDIRAEILTPERLNTLVFGGFALLALAISIVGVSGVLAFSVSARTREFGIRLAIGSQPRTLLTGVLFEGVVIALLGVVIGGAGGFLMARAVSSYLEQNQLPGALPILASAGILLLAAGVASLLPAARAARVDVIQALRTE